MTSRTRNRILALCSAGVLLAAVMGFVVWRRAAKKSALPGRLTQLVRSEAPVPDRMRAGSPSQLADEYPEFRKWLLGIIVEPTNDFWLRNEALHTMYYMKNGTAVYEMVEYLLPRLEEKGAGSNDERHRRMSFRTDIFFMALLADWPTSKAFEVARAAKPGDWRKSLEAHAAQEPGPRSPWLDEAALRIKARAKDLLEYADSQQLPEPGEDAGRKAGEAEQ